MGSVLASRKLPSGIGAALCAALVALAAWIPVSQADLFDRARQSTRIQEPRFDSTGFTARGGVALQTGQQGSVELLRIQGSTGGGCGSFDFGASLRQAFEELPDVFLNMLGAAITNLPMLILCYESPTLCDMAKHWQGLMNLTIQARYAQCQQVQTAMAYAGMRLRGGATSQCLEDEANTGADLNTAMRRCNRDVSSVRGPDGQNRQSVELISETLSAAGATQETQTVAREMLGTVTISANGNRLGYNQDRRAGALLRRFEGHQSEARSSLRTAIDEYRATGDISEASLRQLSVPGQPVPRAAIEALAFFERDPVRFESAAGKLTTGLAITQLTWQCAEIRETLAQAADGNQHLTDEQRRLLEKQIEGLGRELQSVLQKTTVVSEHLQPAIAGILQEYQGIQQLAAGVGVNAARAGAGRAPFQFQLPMGYRQ